MAHRGLIYQAFKYAVYAFLTANVFFFFAEEWAASAHRFADGVALSDIIEGFAATIDTAAWVVLLLMFELETFVLEDRHFTRRVTWTLHGLRFVCYVFIVYAFTGYFRKLLFVTASVPLAGVSDLCTLVDGTWTYAVENTGNVDLTDLLVTDDQGVSVDCTTTELAVEASTVCTATGGAIVGQYVNTGTIA